MKHIDRNPDVALKPASVKPFAEQMPPGMTFIEGKNLHHTARSKGIPLGEATLMEVVNYPRRYTRKVTKGLVIRDGDVARLHAALAVRGKYQRKT